MWKNFNDSKNQQSFDLIPNKTIAKVRMTIKPGGYDDINQGWTDGYVTKNPDTGSTYLSCEFVVLEGEFSKRKIWSLIGLHSPKGPEWGNIGRSFIKAILNSARGISENDISDNAQSARIINGLEDLDGIIFVAKINITKDQNGYDKNEIRFAITPDHKDYAGIMGAFDSSDSSLENKTNDKPSWAGIGKYNC